MSGVVRYSFSRSRGVPHLFAAHEVQFLLKAGAAYDRVTNDIWPQELLPNKVIS